MVRKFVVKADPEVLSEFCLGLLARFLIRIMHKCCMVLKRFKLPVSSSDFKLSEEILEFLEEYHPQIIRMNTTANNTSFLDSTFSYAEGDAEFAKQRDEEEERKTERKKKEIEEEIRRQQENLIQQQMKLFQIYASQNQSGNAVVNKANQRVILGDYNTIMNQASNTQTNNTNNNLSNQNHPNINQFESINTKIHAESKSIRSKSLNGGNIDQLTMQRDHNDMYTRLAAKERQKSPQQQQQSNDLEDDDTMNHIDFNDSSSKNEDSSEKVTNNNNNIFGTNSLSNNINNNSDKILPDSLLNDYHDFQLDRNITKPLVSQTLQVAQRNVKSSNLQNINDEIAPKDKQSQKTYSSTIENIYKRSQEVKRVTPIRSTYSAAYQQNPLKLYSDIILKAEKLNNFSNSSVSNSYLPPKPTVSQGLSSEKYSNIESNTRLEFQPSKTYVYNEFKGETSSNSFTTSKFN